MRSTCAAVLPTSNPQPGKETTMRFASLATTLTLATLMTYGMPSWAGTEVMHPHDLHGSMVLQNARCSDNETGQQGVCFIIRKDGVIYMAFHPPGEDALFLRRLNEDGTYSTIWHRDTDGAVPAGTPL